MREAQLHVILLSHTPTPQKLIASAIRQCYSEAGAHELFTNLSSKKQNSLIQKVVAAGHLSTIEHISFTFAIEGISRACSHQLVRHRIASFSQQSQRYVALDKKRVRFVVPPLVKKNKTMYQGFVQALEKAYDTYEQLLNLGMKPEDARFLLPQAIETKLVMTMNARSLLNFFQERLCRRAQWEIHLLAQKMLKLVQPLAPQLFSYSGPTCQTQKVCWEGTASCGLWKTIKDARLASRLD